MRSFYTKVKVSSEIQLLPEDEEDLVHCYLRSVSCDITISFHHSIRNAEEKRIMILHLPGGCLIWTQASKNRGRNPSCMARDMEEDWASTFDIIIEREFIISSGGTAPRSRRNATIALLAPSFGLDYHRLQGFHTRYSTSHHLLHYFFANVYGHYSIPPIPFH